MQKPSLIDFCSQYFQYTDLICCGETWELHRPENMPLQNQSWVDLAELAKNLLDPITEHFSKPILTYGFAGPRLQKLIRQKPRPQIAPHLDQHAASELNSNGKLICPRAGAAVDLKITGISTCKLALWIAKELPFDRMYLYGSDRSIHLSFHQQPKRQIVQLRQHSGGKLIPSKLSLERLATLNIGVDS